MFFIQIVPNSHFQQVDEYFGESFTKDMARFVVFVSLYHKRPGKYDIS
jgi:hypothetical protein